MSLAEALCVRASLRPLSHLCSDQAAEAAERFVTECVGWPTDSRRADTLPATAFSSTAATRTRSPSATCRMLASRGTETRCRGRRPFGRIGRRCRGVGPSCRATIAILSLVCLVAGSGCADRRRDVAAGRTAVTAADDDRPAIALRPHPLPRQFAQTLLLVPARDAQGNSRAPTPSSVVGGIPHFTYLIARFVALHSTRLTTQRFLSLCRVISPPPSMQYMYNVRPTASSSDSSDPRAQRGSRCLAPATSSPIALSLFCVSLDSIISPPHRTAPLAHHVWLRGTIRRGHHRPAAVVA